MFKRAIANALVKANSNPGVIADSKYIFKYKNSNK
jgi:hypothetical protein